MNETINREDLYLFQTNKQKREYVLDEDGNRIKDAKGKDIFNAVSTTGWNDPELLKEWRRAWTEKVNEKFRECHMAARIDHRSYKEQGIDLLPTIHEGYEVRAMEKKGIKTVIGELNRAIRQFNQMIISLKESMVYRFGHVVGDSETGVCNDGDFIFRIIKSCLILGAYPDIKGSIAPIAIDDVAKIVVGISQIEDQYGKTYHVINTKKISFQDAVDIVCIIDSVTNHCNFSFFFQLTDHLLFSFRKYACNHFINSGLLSDGFCSTFVISGQHDYMDSHVL